jgi:glycosyltransferase involved in cell wall biosynthesis
MWQTSLKILMTFHLRIWYFRIQMCLTIKIQSYRKANDRLWCFSGALIRALSELLNNHEKRNALGKAGREYVEKTHNDHKFITHFDKIVDFIQKQ